MVILEVVSFKFTHFDFKQALKLNLVSYKSNDIKLLLELSYSVLNSLFSRISLNTAKNQVHEIDTKFLLEWFSVFNLLLCKFTCSESCLTIINVVL